MAPTPTAVHAPRRRRALRRTTAALVALALVTSCTDGGSEEGSSEAKVQELGDGSTYEATIRWTDGMVPNIVGDTLADVTFGQGWASGATRPCDLLDMVIKYRGERSATFGPGDGDANITSDLGWRAIGIADVAAQDWPNVSEDLQTSMEAFAAGWNAHLAEVGADALPGWCAGEPWLRDVTPEEVYLYARGVALFASSSQVIDYVANAEPPASTPPSAKRPAAPAPEDVTFEPRTGSNAWAIGSERTTTGGGALLMNPHLTWDGELRWSEVHLTVPGEVDIYGAQLAGVPGIGMGFTESFGWAHTTALGNRFTFATLDLVPGSPTSYRYGDEVREMTREEITIEVLGADGTLEPQAHTRWRSHQGPILEVPGIFEWSESQAVAFRDANIDNDEFAEQYLAMTAAKDLDDFIEIQRTYQGQPVFNTLAASADGRIWFGDVAATPNLSPEAEAIYREQLQSDPLVAEARNRRVALLDGSDPRFEWQEEPGARDPGLIPFDDMPITERSDYLFNANDASWFSNADELLTGPYSVLHGATEVEQSPRSRQNAITLDDTGPTAPSGDDGLFDLDELATAALDDRSFTAEALKDEVVSRCDGAAPQALPAMSADGNGTDLPEATIDLDEACAVLDGWDGRFDVDSVGAVLWREFSAYGGIRWETPFDPADPLGTPAGLAAAPADGDDPTLVSLAQAVRVLDVAGFGVDVALAEVQIAVRNGVEVPVPGGNEGITNAVGFGGVPAPTSFDPSGRRIQTAPFAPGSALNRVTGSAEFTGYPISGGTSFVLALAYGPDGPEAKALLTYGNTSDETDPEFVEATERFAEKRWRDVPFQPDDVAAATTSTWIVRGA